MDILLVIAATFIPTATLFLVLGYYLATVRIPQSLSKLTPTQLSALAVKVQDERDRRTK